MNFVQALLHPKAARRSLRINKMIKGIKEAHRKELDESDRRAREAKAYVPTLGEQADGVAALWNATWHERPGR